MRWAQDEIWIGFKLQATSVQVHGLGGFFSPIEHKAFLENKPFPLFNGTKDPTANCKAPFQSTMKRNTATFQLQQVLHDICVGMDTKIRMEYGV